MALAEYLPDSVLEDFQVFLVVDVFFLVLIAVVIDHFKRRHFAVRFVERVVVDFKGISNGKKSCLDRGIPISPACGRSSRCSSRAAVRD